MFSSAGNVLLLAFGFGFVIFWHELGHFLAAKWADVKVEQFAVGFGQALFSWRKGLGLRWGSTQAEYGAKVRAEVERQQGRPANLTPAVADEGAAGAATFGDLPTDSGPRLAGDPTDVQLDAAARSLGLSDTEYRLNWIPLGGYVKMLGQDDLRPGIDAPDPRSYTSKPVAKRMVIVSAGVTMNVILAAIGFVAYFSVGPKVPSATVGEVVPGSPASMAYRVVGGERKPAPLVPGDNIQRIDGRWQADDFDKIRLNTPLLIPGEPVPVVVTRVDGRTDTVMIAPAKPTPDAEFPLLGIAPSSSLDALTPDDELAKLAAKRDPALALPEVHLIRPGDKIVAVDGRPVTADEFYKLMDALQERGGRPLPVTVRRAGGAEQVVELPAHFQERFGTQDVDFGGLQMLPQVIEVYPDSPLKGQLRPGDIVVDVADAGSGGGHQPMPTRDELSDFLQGVAKADGQARLTVMRDGRTVALDPVKFDAKHRPVDVAAFGYADGGEPVIARPPEESAAAAAGVPAGAVVRSVDGRPAKTWFDVWQAVSAVKPQQKYVVVAAVDGQERPFELRPLTDAERAAVAGNRLTTYAVLRSLQPATTIRRAKGVLQAAAMGAGETRDAILQVYLTLRAMVRGGISPKEISGPVGILAVGYKIAEAGSLKLLWFLSIISANLAVMNFLPIPVVDGGLFTFLCIEKLKGSPVSQRTQVIAQYVGLTLLLSVFLFATYQDIGRIPMLFHG